MNGQLIPILVFHPFHRFGDSNLDFIEFEFWVERVRKLNHRGTEARSFTKKKLPPSPLASPLFGVLHSEGHQHGRGLKPTRAIDNCHRLEPVEIWYTVKLFWWFSPYRIRNPSPIPITMRKFPAHGCPVCSAVHPQGSALAFVGVLHHQTAHVREMER